MHVCFIQIKKSMTTAPSDLLLANAVSCTVSVVKADLVQGRAATNLVTTIGKSICYLSVGLYK